MIEPADNKPQNSADSSAIDSAAPSSIAPSSPAGDASSNALTIEKWVYGGAGLGRKNGQVVMVPFVLPGEQVEIDVTQSKASMLEARAAAWVTRSEVRIEPRCPYFAHCGGCHYQHAPYEFQVQQKVEIVREVLRRVGKVTLDVEVETLSGEPWQYRNRSQFHLSNGKIGYLAAGSHDLVPVDQCPISSPKINDALKVLNELIRSPKFPRFVTELELFTNEEQVMVNVLATENDRHVARSFFEWLEDRIPGTSAGALQYDAGDLKFRVSHGSFFQVNRFLVKALTERAVEGAHGKTALDLYAGVGLFSLPLARQFGACTAVESSTSAARDLVFNAEAYQVKVDVHRMQAEQFLELLKDRPDFVLADPPRSGLGKHVVRHLIRLRPKQLTLVSCDPATLARDLSSLLQSGYRVRRFTVVDLFPQTFHVESVVHLELAD